MSAPKYKGRPSTWPDTWLSSKNTNTNTKNLNTNTRPFEGEARYVTCHLAQYVWNPFGAPTKNNTAGQMYEVGVREFRIFLGKQIIVSKNYNLGAPIENNIGGKMFCNEFYSLTISKKKSSGQIHWKEIWRSNTEENNIVYC